MCRVELRCRPPERAIHAGVEARNAEVLHPLVKQLGDLFVSHIPG